MKAGENKSKEVINLNYCLPDSLIPNLNAKSNSDFLLFQHLGFVNPRHARACLNEIEKEFRSIHPDHYKIFSGNKRAMLALAYMGKPFRKKLLRVKVKNHLEEKKNKAQLLKGKKLGHGKKSSDSNFPSPDFKFFQDSFQNYKDKDDYEKGCIEELKSLQVPTDTLDDATIIHVAGIWGEVCDRLKTFKDLNDSAKEKLVFEAHMVTSLFGGNTFQHLSEIEPGLADEFSIAKRIATLNLSKEEEFNVWLKVMDKGINSLELESEKENTYADVSCGDELLSWEEYFTQLRNLAEEALATKPSTKILSELDELTNLRSNLPTPEPEVLFPFKELLPLHYLAVHLREILKKSSSSVMAELDFQNKIIAYWQKRILDTAESETNTNTVIEELNNQTQQYLSLEKEINEKTSKSASLKLELEEISDKDLSGIGIAQRLEHEDQIADLEDDISSIKRKLSRLKRRAHQSFLGYDLSIEDLDGISSLDWGLIAKIGFPDSWLKSLSELAGNSLVDEETKSDRESFQSNEEVATVQADAPNEEKEDSKNASDDKDVLITEEALDTVEIDDVTDNFEKVDSEIVDDAPLIESNEKVVESNAEEPVEEMDIEIQPQKEEPIEENAGSDGEASSGDEPVYNDPNITGYDMRSLINHSIDTKGVIEADRVNQLAMLLIANNDIPGAYQAIRYAEQSEIVTGQLLPSILLKAAFYGSYIWTSRSKPLPYLSEMFASSLTVSRIESWEEEAHEFCSIISALAFASCFQVALFEGNKTSAPQLLNHIKGRFNEHVADLVRDANKEINKGYKFPLESLSDQTAVKEKLTNIAVNLKQWRHRVEKLDKGYAPAIKAMKKTLKEGELASVVEIIVASDVSQVERIQSFCDEYCNHNQQAQLVKDMVDQVQPRSSEGLQGNALTQMVRIIEELVHYASDWLFEVSKEDDSYLVSDLARRKFITQIDGAIEHYSKPNGGDLTHIAAKAVMLSVFTGIKNAVKNLETVAYSDRELPILEIWPLNRCEKISSATNPEDVVVYLSESLDEDSSFLSSAQKALDLKLWSVARVMLNKANLEGQNVSKIEDAWSSSRDKAHKDLTGLINTATSQLYNAHLCSIITDTRYYKFKSELESIEDLLQKKDDFRDYKALISDVVSTDKEISASMGVRLQALQSNLDELVSQDELNEPKIISAEWREQVDRAFEVKNIAVIEEMLDQCKEALKTSQQLESLSSEEGKLLSDFRRKEQVVSPYFIDNSAKQVRNALTNNEIFEERNGATKEYAKLVFNMLLDAEQHKKPLKKLEQEFYNKTKKLFDFIGVTFKEGIFKSHFDQDFNYKTSNQFSFIRIPVQTIEGGRPFPDFGEHQNTLIPIIIAWDHWSTEDLTDCLGYFGEDLANAFFISLVAISPEQRDSYAKWCKKDHITMQLLDPVLVAYLGNSQLLDKQRYVPNTLKLTMPFTFSNPYREDMKPAPLEMRYGREREFQSLIKLSGGAAFITGGRQMGKSTILHEVQKRFDQPNQNQYAFLLHFDKYNAAGLDHAKIKGYLWEWMHQQCVKIGLLPPLNISNKEDKDRGYSDALLKMFDDNKDIRVMFLLDEMDKALETDSRNDFEMFRGLRALVDHSKQRCKIAVAGLQNVKRFESMPNHPLYQLGSSLVVGIMNTLDALKLIKEPMAALGYQFADELAPMRIISLTNRHPGLIQVFCKHLVDSLAKQQAEVGSYRVTTEYIEQLYSNTADLKEQVLNRFEITLNLDTSYLIIIYSLLLNELGAAPFLVSEAKEYAEEWKSDFSGMSETQFSAYLDELVGLGVLRQEANSNREYQLRNTNIRNLLGQNPRRIEDNLIKAIENEDKENTDPLHDHRMLSISETFKRPSPLSYRDEKMIVGLTSKREENQLVKSLDENAFKKFQLCIVQGSRALGIDDISDAVPFVREMEATSFGTDDHYHVKVLKSSDGKVISQYINIITSGVKSYPVAAVIPVYKFDSIADMADLVDHFLRMRSEFEQAPNPVRIIFVMDPSSLWYWMQNENIKESHTETPDINILRLQKWTKSSLTQLLSQLDLDDSSTSRDMLFDYSMGWYASLRKLSEIMSKSDDSSLQRLKGYGKLSELDKKTSKVFLTDALAIDKLDWVESLLSNLSEIDGDSMDKQDLIDYLSLYIDESEDLKSLRGLEDLVFQWLIILQIIQLDKRGVDSQQKYKLDPAISASWRSYRGIMD